MVLTPSTSKINGFEDICKKLMVLKILLVEIDGLEDATCKTNGFKDNKWL